MEPDACPIAASHTGWVTVTYEPGSTREYSLFQPTSQWVFSSAKSDCNIYTSDSCYSLPFYFVRFLYVKYTRILPVINSDDSDFGLHVILSPVLCSWFYAPSLWFQSLGSQLTFWGVLYLIQPELPPPVEKT